MGFPNRSLTHRGSKRRVRAIKARDHWSWSMTALVVIVLGALILLLYMIVTHPPQHSR
ncbi:MAG TPA: hypothetical protein VH583_17190 [Vicinamibacterales bacterium]|jgi:hypothetical protein